MIECVNAAKLFNETAGIKNINLQFLPGIIYGIIGYNGAGKTTLLRCIEGLYLPTSGCVYHNGVKTSDQKDFFPIRKRIAFLPTEDYLYNRLTCMDNIELATILRTGKNKILKETSKLIKYFEVNSFLNKRFKDCSTGMKKKVQLIISLIGEIDTIIWDEPNDGLDIVSNIKIKNLLNYYKSKNVTILFSCHVIEFLDNFIDYCFLLKDGSVVEAMEVKNVNSLNELYISHINKDDLIFPFNNDIKNDG
ncbi:ABC transporter ATP-binding protein [Treponema primitia]|uniref:ATP-binding cassette domain-containing protein n=1 Tax=Treponema primitia TaxID=88058 RepID=UPI00398032F2